MIKAVIFDFDGTLVDFVEADLASLRLLHEHAGLPVPVDEFTETAVEAIMRFHALVDENRKDPLLMHSFRLKQTFEHYGLPWKDDYVDFYRACLVRACRPLDGVVDLLQFLRGRVKTGLLTNAYDGVEQRARIEQAGLTGLLDAENCRFEPLYEGRLDETNKAYATVNLNGLNGKTYLMSWIPGWNSQQHPGMLWGGCLSLPREVSLTEKGALSQRPARQVRELAGTPVTACDGMAIRDTCFCLSADRVPAGFRLEITSQEEKVFAAEWDGAGLHINGERFDVTPEDGFQLYWDVCVWEMFIGGGAHCITGMRDQPLQTARLSLRGHADVLFSTMRAGSCGYDIPNGYRHR